ncbi:MAG TPA: transglutaminase domain-containing protein [Verrucomicrobiae bacterium]
MSDVSVSELSANRRERVSRASLVRGLRRLFVHGVWVWRVLVLISLPLALCAVSLDELMNGEKMTPKKFASYFKDFEYKFHPEIQPVEVFLETRNGDCDDYALLADKVLRKHGFTTRLVSIRMPGLLTHVVCYVNEEKVYLDFNNRVYLTRTERCDPDLRVIAQRVAKSFEANWTSVSEFTYSEGVKELVKTVSKTDVYADKEEDKKAEAAVTAPAKKKIVIDF